jgi:hypothetical protein
MTIKQMRIILIEDFGINPLDLLYIDDAEVINLYDQLMEIKNRVTRA